MMMEVYANKTFYRVQHFQRVDCTDAAIFVTILFSPYSISERIPHNERVLDINIFDKSNA